MPIIFQFGQECFSQAVYKSQSRYWQRRYLNYKAINTSAHTQLWYRMETSGDSYAPAADPPPGSRVAFIHCLGGHVDLKIEIDRVAKSKEKNRIPVRSWTSDIWIVRNQFSETQCFILQFLFHRNHFHRLIILTIFVKNTDSNVPHYLILSTFQQKYCINTGYLNYRQGFSSMPFSVIRIEAFLPLCRISWHLLPFGLYWQSSSGIRYLGVISMLDGYLLSYISYCISTCGLQFSYNILVHRRDYVCIQPATAPSKRTSVATTSVSSHSSE
jgi:hypothetical protein